MIQRVNTGASAGFEVKPMRQPVIAQVFDAPSEMMVRSYMPGTCAMEKNSPDVAQARIDLVRVDPDLRVLLQDLPRSPRVPSSVSDPPVGLCG